MIVDLSQKRQWAKQRRFEANEIRRVRRLIKEGYYRENKKNSLWANAEFLGVMFGLFALAFFKVIVQVIK
jgi:hypothetical protein